MPTLQTGDRTYKVSFSDVFKSSKTLREEQLAYAALRVILANSLCLNGCSQDLIHVRRELTT